MWTFPDHKQRAHPESGETEIVYGGPHADSFRRVLGDFQEGLRRYEFWHNLAWNDVKARYRRTWLGEFWMVASLAIFVLSVGTVYVFLLNLSLSTYLPYLTIGYTFWSLFASLTIEGCQAFIVGSNALRQTRTPLTALVLRNVDKAFLTLVHNLVVVIIVLGLFRIWPNWNSLLFIPALALWWLNGMWLSFILGILSARFRDVSPIVANLLQILFLVSPVLWNEDSAPSALQHVAMFNPLSHFLLIVRNPLLGVGVPVISWYVVAIIMLAGWVASAFLLRSYRRRIPYWV